jgi:hypothetical protein
MDFTYFWTIFVFVGLSPELGKPERGESYSLSAVRAFLGNGSLQGALPCTKNPETVQMHVPRHLVLQGDITTMEWRMFFKEGGKPISPWHDIPLKAGEGVYNFVCEIPKDTMAKMESCLVGSLQAAVVTY